jgi:hypothetical protein
VVAAASCFLSVMWRVEAFHGLGVQGVKVSILLGPLFLPSVAPAPQQVLESRSSCCLLLHPSRHLDSFSIEFCINVYNFFSGWYR